MDFHNLFVIPSFFASQFINPLHTEVRLKFF
jgi:hypothetical protein